MDWNDVAREEALANLHYEAVMKRAAQEQAIYLFVEGDSEEVAVPMLMTDVVNLEALGVRIANYNGHGNLRAALRLLYVVLGHERPVIVTHDNDPASLSSVARCRNEGLFTSLTYALPIPAEAVVRYSDDTMGGAFEESFPLSTFIKAVFQHDILPVEVRREADTFVRAFDAGRPWLNQLQGFCADRGFRDWVAAKPRLAEALAEETDALPPTWEQLAELIDRVREDHPVVHPDEVELPRVAGLTYNPGWPPPST